MSKIVLDLPEGTKISDGYHTFDELYDHRCLLFLNLCLMNKEQCFFKIDYAEWFCLYWESPVGQISYHLPNKWLAIAEKNFTHSPGHTFDGHTSSDVIERLITNARIYDSI